MTIRQAQTTDLSAIMSIYDTAREFMRQNGNQTQWSDGYPQEHIIRQDISDKTCFIIEEKGIPAGVFSFFIGDDETYRVIDGKWLSDDTHGVIHKVASNGKCRGLFDEILAFCLEKISSLRIDTHRDNLIMQHILEKNGFKKCGIIITHDGTERLAYQRI